MTRTGMRQSRWAVALAFLCAVLGRAANGRAQSGPLSLVLSPTSGMPGTTVEANGTGFSAATCGVSLTLDTPTGTLLGNAVVSGGTFSIDITIPAGTSEGQHVVLAHGMLLAGEFCTAPSNEEARAVFFVGHFAGEPVTPFVFAGDLRDLPKVRAWQEGDPVFDSEGQEDEEDLGSPRETARARHHRLRRRHISRRL